jgi:L-cysteine desulfidase
MAIKMTKDKLKVEIDAHDPTVIYINGKRYSGTKIVTSKKDAVTHVERILFNEVNEKQYAEDLKLIVNTLKARTDTEELLTQMFKEVSPRVIKKIAKRIRENKPIKKHKGCLGFKFGDSYIQLIGGDI